MIPFGIENTKNSKYPLFDLPVDFVVYDKITADILNLYGKFPCKIRCCVFAYLIEGEASATINLWKYTIKKGDFVIIMPGSFIQIDKVSNDIRIGIMAFSSSFLKTVNFWKSMSPLMITVFKKPILTLDENLGEIYGEAIGLLTRASLLNTDIISPHIAADVMKIIIESLSEAMQRNMVKSNDRTHSSRDHEILSEFLQLAFENYREEHKISFYAHEANLTLSHFCNVISKASGMTPQEIIMNLIIMDAKTQLRGSDATVSSIAASLGFPTPTTFNRYFRTYTQMTPQEYRNSK